MDGKQRLAEAFLRPLPPEDEMAANFIKFAVRNMLKYF
jgi:hypothetical protein